MNLNTIPVVLVGLGRSSLAAARLLQMKGARPYISEFEGTQRVEEWQDQATQFGIPCEVGGHSRSLFDEAQLAIVSPGVPLTAPCLQWLRQKDIPILGELEFASRFCTAPILAVTGTNGKTTVTTLLQAMLQSSGFTAALAGNNDTPLSQVMLEAVQPDYIVAEVSSYQLETTDTFHPLVGVVLNLTEDHLGRHGSMEAYAAVKSRIFVRQTSGDAAVLNADDPFTSTMCIPDGVLRFSFSLRQPAERTLYADEKNIYYEEDIVASLEDNPLPGKHNLSNVLAALAVIKAAGLSWEGALKGLRTFKGVEHRIEHVLSFKGVDYYNDSKSTNTDSLRVALESFSRPVVLMAGGRGKGGDYTVLNALVGEHVKHLVLFGEDANKMATAFYGLAPITQANSMPEAIKQALAAADEGDVVLLSPGCASFDMYDNFEARGRDFKDKLRQLTNAAHSDKENMP